MTNKSVYKPTWLYIKQHTVTKLLYFGKTTQKDPVLYSGSGKYWRRHIKHHGKNDVITLWFCLFTELDDLIRTAIAMSHIMQIVESDNWANLCIETGLSSLGYQFTKEQRTHMSEVAKGKPKSQSHRVNIAKANTLRKRNPLTNKQKQNIKLGMQMAKLARQIGLEPTCIH